MKPDDADPADNEPNSASSDEEEIPLPRVSPPPALPEPPEIEFHRPRLAGRPGVASGGTGRQSGYPSPSDAGSGGSSAGRIGAGLSIGLSFGLTIVICIGAGMLLDEHYQAIKPWGTIVGCVVGLAAGFLNLFRSANALLNRNKP